jgi:hypothetical protein
MLPGALEPARALHRAHHPAHRRTGRHEHTAAIVLQIDERRRFEAILDFVRLRAERILEADVELGPDRNLVRGRAARCRGRRRTAIDLHRLAVGVGVSS